MPEFLFRYARHGYMAHPDGLAAKASGVIRETRPC
jgi:hypothetical protein